MPERETIKRARKDAREGKAPSTQAGEFVREEIEHVRQGKHGARSTKQAIAIGLSKARRAGVRRASSARCVEKGMPPRHRARWRSRPDRARADEPRRSDRRRREKPLG